MNRRLAEDAGFDETLSVLRQLTPAIEPLFRNVAAALRELDARHLLDESPDTPR